MVNKTAARDAIHGLALGDAYGETFFFPDRPAESPWRWTDDTAMALPLLDVLRRHGHVDQDALATAFAEAYTADPYRNYGASMHDVLQAIGAGESWRVVTRRQFDGQGSWGNGAAMRVAPLGAWFADDLDTVIEQATLSAAVTHAHPEATAGAVAIAVAAALNRAGTLHPHDVAERVPDSVVRKGLLDAGHLEADTPIEEVARILGNGRRISAPDTVPLAVWCATRHSDNLVEALTLTATAGGDVDTTCAMVGGIVAGRAGLGTVPPEWVWEPLPAWVDELN
jgi:ADP-ribosylglycohydrolase